MNKLKFCVFYCREINKCILMQTFSYKFAGKLKIVHLQKTYIGRACFKAINHFIKLNLTDLIFERCKISWSSFSDFIHTIAKSNLQVLYFNEVADINYEMFKSLVQLMTYNGTNLKVVALITTDCRFAEPLVEAMQHSTVEKLMLHEHCKYVMIDSPYSVTRKIVLTNYYHKYFL